MRKCFIMPSHPIILTWHVTALEIPCWYAVCAFLVENLTAVKFLVLVIMKAVVHVLFLANLIATQILKQRLGLTYRHRYICIYCIYSLNTSTDVGAFAVLTVFAVVPKKLSFINHNLKNKQVLQRGPRGNLSLKSCSQRGARATCESLQEE